MSVFMGMKQEHEQEDSRIIDSENTLYNIYVGNETIVG